MGVAQLLGVSLAFSLGAMLLLWLASLALRNASIVDIWWGPGFACIALLSYLLASEGHPIALVLTALWGLRLGGYLWLRNAGHGEDPRYQAMRRHHGERFPLVSLFTVFALQGSLMWFVSIPVQLAQVAGMRGFGPFELLGTVLFAVGLGFEAVGDWQLSRFRADPANAAGVMDRGLWRYTRHPNYFGDCCVWWGLFALALPTPGGVFSVASPLVMTFFLLRVSGVPMLERSIHKRRPGYPEYVRRTSAFFPMPPRG